MIELKRARWEKFQSGPDSSGDASSQELMQSWIRCSYQCSAVNWSAPHVASGSTLRSLLRRSDNLLHCGTTVLEDTFDMMRGSSAILMITDDNGCLLHIVGEKGLQKEISELGLVQGCFFSEGKTGTTAVTLCLTTHLTVEVVAADHFNCHLHPYAACAAPVFDSLGKIRGTVSMFLRCTDYHENNPVMIDACARQVSMQMQIQHDQDSLNKLISLHDATLASMDDGLLSWNRDNRITMINPQAEKILGITGRPLMEKPVLNLIRFAPNILSRLTERNPVQRTLTTVEVGSEFLEVLISVNFLSEGAYFGAFRTAISV